LNTNNVIKFKSVLNLIFLSLLIGVFSGVIGTLFAKCISFVTTIRIQYVNLIYLLPLAGLFIVFLYKKLKVSGVGTNQVISSCEENTGVSFLLMPAIFLGTAISHLFGASVGREGAALQIGGGLASLLSRIFHLDEQKRKILTYCGMAGLFSAVFGTPLAAFFFSLQIAYVWKINLKSVIPTFIASGLSYFTSKLLNAHHEHFYIKSLPDFSLGLILKVILIAILSALIAMLFCYSLRWSKKLFKYLFKNEYLRIAIGGIITVFLTVLLRNTDYNGAGINIIEQIFENGNFAPEAFFIKLVFTCIAIASGFKGGEIVPSLFIGATFGALIASLLGIPVELGALVGMTALFCGATNCPLAAIFLSLEMFSGKGLLFILISVLVSYVVSGRISLYSAQKIKFESFFKNT